MENFQNFARRFDDFKYSKKKNASTFSSLPAGTLIFIMIAMEDFSKKPLRDVKKLAGTGNLDAIYELALRYRDGRGGVFEDIEQAEKYFREAAERDCVPAQLALAEIVETYDEDEAAQWRSRANRVPAKSKFKKIVFALIFVGVVLDLAYILYLFLGE